MLEKQVFRRVRKFYSRKCRKIVIFELLWYNLRVELGGFMFDKVKKFFDAKRTVSNWDYVFQYNPEIEKIGSRQEYVEYVQSIFPESSVKSVFFHGGPAGIDKFLTPKDKGYKLGAASGVKDYGIYFTKDRGLARNYAKNYKKRNVYPVVLNMKRPLTTNIWFAGHIRKLFNKDLLVPESITTHDYELLSKAGYDSIIWQGENGEVIVFNPEQIHILGTQEDLDKFKQWKTNKIMTKVITQNLGHEQG